jgi:competence protein ComEA
MPFDRRLVLLLLVAGAAALIVVGRVLPRPSGPAAELAPAVSVSAGSGSTTGAAGASGPVVVHVVGAVRHPGVYRLPAGSRTRDAVRRAGGAGRRADLGGVNLATRLADGEQVRVPQRTSPAAVATGTAPDVPPAIVHLNSASAEQLDALDGIGPALAQRIVDYRASHGGFGSIDELDEVSGIGPVRLESLRPRLAL